MGFFKKSENQNFDLLSGYAWHVPGVGGMFGMLVWLLVGAVIGNCIGAIFMFADNDEAMAWGTLVAYVVMFMPPMVASKRNSFNNSAFETGYALTSRHFGKTGFLCLAGLCILATVACSYAMDLVNAAMPPMPQWLSSAMEEMTSGGNVWLNLFTVSVCAPFFEEWLCRGTILRGLLNFRHKNSGAHSSGAERGLKPWAAICISSIFFAFIHLNPWQAIPAFVLGCLFGWVYYKTGSLWLTMIMHCANNTMAVLVSRVDAWSEAETFLDIMPFWAYGIGFIAAIVLIWLLIRSLRTVELNSPQGNCDPVSAYDPLGNGR